MRDNHHRHHHHRVVVATPRERVMPRDAMRCDATPRDTRHAIRTWILVALKAATRETKEDARRADIFKEMRGVQI